MPRSVKRGRFVRYDDDDRWQLYKDGRMDREGNWIPTEQERRDEIADGGLREWERKGGSDA